LALFGRRPHQRVDSSIIPATENLHKVGHRERSNQTRDCTPAIQAPIPGESSESCATNLPTMSRLRSERCRTSGAACRASVIGVSSTATWGSCGSGCAPYEYTPRGTALGSKANVPEPSA
jgi:hypothetical protein